MKATNQIFDWNRFTLTLRKEFTENWRTLMLIAAGIYLWYTIALIINNVATLNGSYTINPMFFMCIAAIIASMSFRKLTTRTGRADLLTSPSSTAEKYITNLLIYVIAAFVIFALCFQLADITRYVIISIFGPKMGIDPTAPNNLVETFRTAGEHMNSYKNGTLTILIDTLGAGAIFFLGSVLWPRRSVIKTATLILVFTLTKLIALGVSIYVRYGDNVRMIPSNMIKHHMNQAVTFNLWFDTIIYVMSLILAWYIIKHKDVITLKWWR